MYLEEYYPKLLQTLIFLVTISLLRFIINKTVQNFTKRIERLEHRTGLIKKHINFAAFFILIVGLIVIWGVFHDLGLFMSSIFAVIGIAFFAQWSILSNITSGVIMFFTFPYKIGDYIKIHDHDRPCEGIIADIKTFHIILHTSEHEIITYPNSMMLQKGVSIISAKEYHDQHPKKDEDKNIERHPED